MLLELSRAATGKVTLARFLDKVTLPEAALLSSNGILKVHFFLGHPVYPIKILLIINHDNILSEKLLNKCEYWEWTPCSFWWCFTSSSWFQLLRTGFFKCECWEWYSLTCEQSDFVSEKELAKCEKIEYFGKRMDPLLPRTFCFKCDCSEMWAILFCFRERSD